MEHHQYIVKLGEIARTAIDLAGGKAVNLGELTRMEGIQVPGGFCITTKAYKEIFEDHPLFYTLLDELDSLKEDDLSSINTTSAKIRKLVEEIPIPEPISQAITHHLQIFGDGTAFAVRSSATAEDLPSASFAGQQDTYLNITGKENILIHISKCWASLFTDRAVMYRKKNNYGHRNISLAVIIQEMIFSDVSGIMFTADPVTSNRKTVSIDAGFGLGEALVSGLVNADNYKVKNGKIVHKNIPAKKISVTAHQKGGTLQQEIKPGQQNLQALTDEEILQLEQIGRHIEAHFNHPQDIEWSIAGSTIYILQTRPVTTLYPIPETTDDKDHVYISVGHQQMMTDPISPLGLSFYLLITRAPMRTAGGRLFVDVAPMLATAAGRQQLLSTIGAAEPLIKDALMTLMDQEDVVPPLAGDDEQKEIKPPTMHTAASPGIKEQEIKNGPAVVAGIIQKNQTALSALKESIAQKTGPALFEFIRQDIEELKKFLFDPESLAALMSGIHAAAWINEKMYEWLGEKNPADTLAQSVPDNITSEMGLALMDVADTIRPFPEVVNYLQNANTPAFLNLLPQLPGGKESSEAIENFLEKYGMRCVGEIDMARTRWAEDPLILVPLILSNIKNFGPGESQRKFEKGLQEALKKEAALLKQLKQLPGGEQKASDTRHQIDMLRTYSGYREYPKYGMVSWYFIYKQALVKEAERMVQQGILDQPEDMYYLGFDELYEAARSGQADKNMILQRKANYEIYKKLTPPRVMTSDGEIISGKYHKENLPEGALPGLAVSTGIIEGRARVMTYISEAHLEEGDILVTTFTDPSWTPLFVAVKGLVTEVGGLMTHGAVIAREYGLPAVVGVEDATRLIKDGQRIRVNGTEGFVEILDT